MPNETIRTILARRSIRQYTAAPVEPEKLELTLQCGQYAPSGVNRQPWHFTLVTNRSLLDQISAENRKIMLQSEDETVRQRAADPGFDSFRGAPVAIIVSGEDEARWAAADCANAMQNMALAAQSLGLGSCYIGSFRLALETPAGAYLLEELKIPPGYTPLYALALGYSAETLGERAPRRPGTITRLD